MKNLVLEFYNMILHISYNTRMHKNKKISDSSLSFSASSEKMVLAHHTSPSFPPFLVKGNATPLNMSRMPLSYDTKLFSIRVLQSQLRFSLQMTFDSRFGPQVISWDMIILLYRGVSKTKVDKKGKKREETKEQSDLL